MTEKQTENSERAVASQDLLKRLREAGNDYTVAWGSGELYDEAADEIERLTAALEHKNIGKVQANEEVTPIMDGYLMKCCDCGLVHRMTFRAIKVTSRAENGSFGFDVLDPKEYRVLLTAERAGQTPADVLAADEPSSGIAAFAEEVKQLCEDFSSRAGNVYIKDVQAAIDALLERQAEAVQVVGDKLARQ
jgi:hypothetical protein